MKKFFTFSLVSIVFFLACVSYASASESLIGTQKVVLNLGSDNPYILGGYYVIYDGNNYILFYSLINKSQDPIPFIMMRKLTKNGELIGERKIASPAASVLRAGWDGTNYYVISSEKVDGSYGPWDKARLHVLQISPLGSILNSASTLPEANERILYVVGSSEKIRIYTKTIRYPWPREWNSINVHNIDFEYGINSTRELPVNEHFDVGAYSFCLTPEGLALIGIQAKEGAFNSYYHVAEWETTGFNTYLLNFNGSLLSDDMYAIPINNISEQALYDETSLNYSYWLPGIGIYCDLKSNEAIWGGWNTVPAELTSYSITISPEGALSQATQSELKGDIDTQILHGNLNIDIFNRRVLNRQGGYFYYKSNLSLHYGKGNVIATEDVPGTKYNPSQLVSTGDSVALFQKTSGFTSELSPVKNAKLITMYPINIPATTKSHIVYAKAGANDVFHNTRHVMWNVANASKVTLTLPDGSIEVHPPVGYTLIKHQDKKQSVILKAAGANGEKIKRIIRVNP